MWPISQPLPEVKQLVYRFFALVDTNSQEIGQVLADEIFTQDGVLITANAMFQGAAEISQSREGAWTTVKTRQHTILKSYVNDAYGTDIFLVGKLDMETLAGTKTNLEFVARMEIEERALGPRICKYQVVSPAPQVS
ncbi:hypothetical protein BDV38DRAFT_278567 [Aspergillus pseudotamarii]|uniref:SnoaL-like domain-containing protein n=1 Tax=Aspergillus pseudotamarii TaxID=132259 RepID=A0A5N6T645_ASPPS|nr:uncharacterized protein BDV38DRAFT_278567 [Aspergillus pseudotamarii]KAE8141783.1 hypothetical protein BDV38DRAFT_278567 [Aspergillus pseudotamarii]